MGHPRERKEPLIIGALILAGEIAFWAFVLGGLVARYLLRRPRLGVAAALGLPALGGSDSHHPKTIGYGHTLFPGNNAEDLRAAIELGQTYAARRSWGPIRMAEVIGLIVRRELCDPAKWVRRTQGQTSPPLKVVPFFADHSCSNPRISYR
jgi:hypothetical protein